MTKEEIDTITKWFKNKEALGFSCRVNIVDKRIQTRFEGLDACYEASANKLCHEMIVLGVRIINDLYKREIDFNDQDCLSKYAVEFGEKNSLFLNTFLNRGADAFHSLVYQHAYIFGAKLKMEKLEFKQGKWMTGNQTVDINSLRQVI